MSGTLVVVGTGVALASQLTPEARDHIAEADVVFAVVGHGVTETWLQRINPNVVSLQPFYGHGRSRAETYEAMTETIVKEVRAGRKVCAAFYGHPGVYVWPSHEAIRRARGEGFAAVMLPGVSAEDCLIADLGVDPGRTGWQSYEATDFFLRRRRIDTSASLVLWQIGVFGDRTLTEFAPRESRVRRLSEALMEDYPPAHEVVVYEAASLPTIKPRIQHLPIARLHEAQISQQSTLYIPPLRKGAIDPARRAMLD